MYSAASGNPRRAATRDSPGVLPARTSEMKSRVAVIQPTSRLVHGLRATRKKVAAPLIATTFVRVADESPGAVGKRCAVSEDRSVVRDDAAHVNHESAPDYRTSLWAA
jgi:hypothetical protein